MFENIFSIQSLNDSILDPGTLYVHTTNNYIFVFHYADFICYSLYVVHHIRCTSEHFVIQVFVYFI